MLGTATPAQVWVAVEHDRPWGARATEDDTLDPPTRAALGRAAAGYART